MIAIELDNIRIRYDIKKKKPKKAKKPKKKGGKKKKFPGDGINKGRDPRDLLAGVTFLYIFVKNIYMYI